MKRFLLDKNYGVFLGRQGLSAEQLLKKAMLPEDLFARQVPSLTTEEYFRLMQAVEDLAPDEETPIRLATADGIEAFSPPIFAAYCSKNALACLKRLAQYKPLVGALLYEVTQTETEVLVKIVSADPHLPLPPILAGMEFAFLTGLIRKATRQTVIPLRAETARELYGGAWAAYLGVAVTVGRENVLVFAKSDALLPFICPNESMWEFLSPELDRRLAMMQTDDSTAARVRSALPELLASGACTVDDAARKLGCSRRTLQRRLQEEGTNFQKQLNHTRELLAKTYLQNTAMTAEDIAFLLGYQEVTAFLRAFALWTGMTVTEYRKRPE